jgi:hypothetical protein
MISPSVSLQPQRRPAYVENNEEQVGTNSLIIAKE